MSEPTSAQMYMPWVVETTHRGERQWDIFSRLLKDRIIFLGTEVNDDVANAIGPVAAIYLIAKDQAIAAQAEMEKVAQSRRDDAVAAVIRMVTEV